MAQHYLGLRYGSNTISLSTGDNILGQYSIRPARLERNGSYSTVDERIGVTVRGSSSTDAQDKFNEIEAILSVLAERKSSGEGQPLYLEFSPANDPVTWRSELLSASLPPVETILELWANGEVQAELEIKRSPFFEGARTAIPLSNRYATNTTSQIRIDNRNDSTHDAFVDIAADIIDGSVPTPLELKIQNDEATGQGYIEFHVGVNARSSPLTMEPVLEAEDMTGYVPVVTTYANASGGEVARFDVTGTGTVYPKWTIPSTWADAFRGRYVRVLMKLGGLDGNWTVRPCLYEFYGLQKLYEGRPRVVDSTNGGEFVDLGVMPLPPVAYTEDLAEQKFGLELYHDSEALRYMNVDFIFFLPTDSGRSIRQRGMQIPAGDFILFDEIERVWCSLESNVKHPIYSPRGPGVMVFPNVAQRIFVLHDDSSLDATAKLKSIQAWYRPRRLTV